MDLRFQRKLRPIAAVTLFFFSWISIEPWNYAAWAQSSPKPKTSVSQSSKTSSGKFEESLRAAKNVVEELDQGVVSGKDITIQLESLKGHKQALESADPEIRAEFAATEKFLKDKKLPQAILDRQAKAVADYDTNYKTLKANLDSVIVLESERKQAEAKGDRAQANKKRGELKTRLKAAKEHLTSKVKAPRHQKLDPNNLPNRSAKPTNRKPRLKKEQFKDMVGASGRSPILLAYNGDPSGLLLAQNTQDLPTPDDLAETIEVQFTTEIQNAANLLEKNPVLLYEFVRNNFKYDPYYGSIKGAQGTLLTNAGNDFDQASLLIALFRLSGIPSRYVYGTVEIPVAKAMSWVGDVLKPEVAIQVLASNGIPATLVYQGSKPVSILLEHVWVEAYLPYTNYRGSVTDSNGSKSWIPLDPSYKTLMPNSDAVDLFEAQGIVIETFFDGYLQTLKPSTPSREYFPTTLQFMLSRFPDRDLSALLTRNTIVEKALALLPNTLAYPVKVVGERFSQVPSTYRHSIHVMLSKPLLDTFSLDYSASWPEVLHKRLTLSYEPATDVDAQVIQQFGDQYSTPPYLINVKPILKLDGVPVAEGSSLGMATEATFKIEFLGTIGVLEDRVENFVTVGEMAAIGLDAGYTTGTVVRKRLSQYQEAANTGLSGDPVLGEFFNLLALSYFEELDASRKVIASTMRMIDTNHSAELMVGVRLAVAYLFDVPKSVVIGGLYLDVARNVATTFDVAGDHAKTRRFHLLSGLNSSALEHYTFEKILGLESISAVKAIQLANTQGIPIHRVDSQNIETELPVLQLSPEVEAEIRDATHAGLIVTVPERNIQLNNWNGVGYIILDPSRGDGAYRISGGINGVDLTQVTGQLSTDVKNKSITPEEAEQHVKSIVEKTWFAPPIDPGKAVRIETRGFDPSIPHYGIDYAVDLGDDGVGGFVYAVQGGYIFSKSISDTYGMVMTINHGTTQSAYFIIESLYAHLCEFLAPEGGFVQGGDKIARAGNTGRVSYWNSTIRGNVYLGKDYPRCQAGDSKGLHLHFEIRINGNPVDPDYYSVAVLKGLF